jgi:hypothetical protein
MLFAASLSLFRSGPSRTAIREFPRLVSCFETRHYLYDKHVFNDIRFLLALVRGYFNEVPGHDKFVFPFRLVVQSARVVQKERFQGRLAHIFSPHDGQKKFVTPQ